MFLSWQIRYLGSFASGTFSSRDSADGQVWHAAIVVAIILHYRATFVAHQSRFEYSCAMPDAGETVGEAWDNLWASTLEAVWGK
jgi:hypothetical protein